MKNILLGILLCLPLLILSASPLDSPHQHPYWLALSCNLLFDPLHNGFKPAGVGMDIDFIFENNAGIGIGASFAEWMNFSVNILYFVPIADLDNLLLPVKLKIHTNYLFKEWVYGTTIAAGVRPALFVSEDSEQRRFFVYGELLASCMLFFNRFDKQVFLFVPELNFGMFGDLSLEEEGYLG